MSRRRKWFRRLLIALNVVVAVGIVATVAAYGYVRYRFNQIPRAACSQCVNIDDAVAPMTVLVVGSDSRSDIKGADASEFCARADCSDQSGPEHSDSIMLLRFDPSANSASVLSIPRDLNVAIAGTTRHDRINSAMAGGVNALIATIRDNLGIVVNHFVVVDFVGFRRIVAAFGGINIYFPAPARDRVSGLNVTTPGCVHLDGDQALSYVRSRHYEYYEAGRWHDDPYSDLSRIQRQQDFIRRVARKALGVRNPLTANALIDAAVHDVRIDRGLSRDDLLRVGRHFHSLSPDAVQMLTVPTDPITISGAQELRLHQPDATATVARFLGEDPSKVLASLATGGVLPNAVRVRVLNGSGVGPVATAMAQTLQSAGFEVAGTGDADSFAYRTSVIRYGTGQLDKARALQATLQPAPPLRSDPTIRSVDLVLVVGSDAPRLVASAASTRAAQATTTTAISTPEATPGGPANRGAAPEPQC